MLSNVIKPEVKGDEYFFSRMARGADFDGLRDPITGFDHFELKQDTFGAQPHAGLSVISYVFENSASYNSLDSKGNNVVITPGSMLWSYAGKGIVGFPAMQGSTVEGLQLFVTIPDNKRQQDPKSVFIDKSDIPEIKQEGVRVRVVCGETAEVVNKIETPDPLTILHVFLESGKEFNHILPPQWSGTVFVTEGNFDFITNQTTIELEQGTVISMAQSDTNEPLKFLAITNCQLLLISGFPLHEESFTEGVMVMDSQEALSTTAENYK